MDGVESMMKCDIGRKRGFVGAEEGLESDLASAALLSLLSSEVAVDYGERF